MPYLDVFVHIGEIRKRQANQYAWLHSIISIPNTKYPQKAARDLRKRLKQLEVNPFEVRESVYDTVDEHSRILMIGSALALKGPDWLDEHPRQRRWLDQRGIEPAECIRRHKDWLAEKTASVPWVPLANKRRKEREQAAREKRRKRRRRK